MILRARQARQRGVLEGGESGRREERTASTRRSGRGGRGGGRGGLEASAAAEAQGRAAEAGREPSSREVEWWGREVDEERRCEEAGGTVRSLAALLAVGHALRAGRREVDRHRGTNRTDDDATTSSSPPQRPRPAAQQDLRRPARLMRHSSASLLERDPATPRPRLALLQLASPRSPTRLTRSLRLRRFSYAVPPLCGPSMHPLCTTSPPLVEHSSLSVQLCSRH